MKLGTGDVRYAKEEEGWDALLLDEDLDEIHHLTQRYSSYRFCSLRNLVQ